MKPSKLISRLFTCRKAAPLAASCSLILVTILVISCTESETKSSESEAKKVVFIAGPPSHPSGMHEFFAGSTLLARALAEQSGLPFEVEVVQNGWPEDESVLEGADAVIIYSDGRGKHPVNGHEETMDAMTARGVGLMCMHYGVDVPAGEQGQYFQKWIGGYYENGFSVNPHWTAEVKLDENHPISSGVPGFTAHDEWYYNMRFADSGPVGHILTAIPTPDKIDRYLSWTAEGKAGLGKRQTMLWAVEREDGGRGVGFTGGHYHRNWALDDFRKVVLNAVVWVAGGNVPEGGVASDAVTEAQLNENLDEKKDMLHVKLPSDADLYQPPAAEKPIQNKKPSKLKAKAKDKAKV